MDTVDDLVEGKGGITADPRHVRADCRLIAQAVREGWDIPAAKRPAIVSRMVEIIEKRTAIVATPVGPVESEASADGQAISAARVLVAMDQVSQGDYQYADKNRRLDEGKATEAVMVVREP